MIGTYSKTVFFYLDIKKCLVQIWKLRLYICAPPVVWAVQKSVLKKWADDILLRELFDADVIG